MANTSAIGQQAAHTVYQLSSPSRSTRAIKKPEEKSQENGPLVEKWQDKKCKTRQRKQKRRQERGIKWQPWDSRQVVNIRHPRPPSEEIMIMIQISILALSGSVTNITDEQEAEVSFMPKKIKIKATGKQHSLLFMSSRWWAKPSQPKCRRNSSHSFWRHWPGWLLIFNAGTVGGNFLWHIT